MSIVLPPPSATYDARNESETRRSIEQALARLSAIVPDDTGTALGGSGTAGKIPIWTGAATLGDSDIDVANLAYLSDLFTQSDADALYAPIVHTHPAGDITNFDAAVEALSDGRYVQIANFNTLGDARYFKLSDTHLNGPLDIGDVTGITAAMLRVGGDVHASGEFDGSDFVLVGGAAGGGAAAALFSVSDEGTPIASSVTSINFIGAGVVASAIGGDVTVEILFDQAAADARYSLLGHTHSASQITDFSSVGDARWMRKGISGQILTDLQLIGNANPFLGLSDGTYNGYLQISGGTLNLYHNGQGRVNMPPAGGVLLLGEVTLDSALHGTTADFSGEVDGSDFVLVGGSGGGGASAALFSVLDEGVLKANNVTSINFTGAGVTASAVGSDVTVEIVFDEAAAQTAGDARWVQLANFNTLGDARYLQLTGGGITGGLTSSGASGGFTAYSRDGDGKSFLMYATGGLGRLWSAGLGDVMWFDLTTGAATLGTLTTLGTFTAPSGVFSGALSASHAQMSGDINPYYGLNDGTYQTYLQVVGGAFSIYHNSLYRLNFPAAGGTQALGAFDVLKADGSLFTVRIDNNGAVSAASSINSDDSFRLAGVPLAAFSTTYNLIYRRDGAYGILLGGSDPSTYYDNSNHFFRLRDGTQIVRMDSGGMEVLIGGVTATGVIRSSSTYGWLLGNEAGFTRIYYAPASSRFEFVNSSNGFTNCMAADFILS